MSGSPVPLLDPPIREWYCPGCTQTAATREARPHTRYHRCAGAGGLAVPMVRAGTRAKQVLVLRPDYIGKEIVQVDDANRPVMSVVTVRDEGMDCTVYAPCATGRGEA